MTPKSNEYDIRACVIKTLLHSGIARNRIRIEVPLDTNSSNGRTDIVVLLDKKIACIELKSGRDKFSPEAIKEQTSVYKRTFDYCAVIVDKIHKKETMEQRIWGQQRLSNWKWVTATYCHATRAILEDGGRARLMAIPHLPTTLFLHASRRTCVYDMLSILWKADIGRGTKCGTIDKWRQEMSLIEAREIVTEALLNRPFNKWEEKFWRKFDAEAAA